VRLKTFSIEGFRSLTKVTGVPVSRPTILAGHNDGGKTAILDALGFLLGTYKPTDDDRTYADGWILADNTNQGLPRCSSTLVEGEFELDAWETSKFALPQELRVRRVMSEDSAMPYECWLPVPDDDRLRDLRSHLVPALKALVRELHLDAGSGKRADLENALRHHAAEHSSSEDWIPAPAGLPTRLPRLLRFDGKTPEPEAAIRTALMGKLKDHVEDETVSGNIAEIEKQLQERVRTDAKSLCDHIRERCPDLSEVSVDPEISLFHSFSGASLKIARASGAPVRLDRSGQGSARRISLAVWEWTSEVLSDEAESAPSAPLDESGEPTQPPVQSIIVYDEPDTHLDYDHQRKIMRLIHEQSAIPNVRVIVATHSMSLIDGVDISDILNLRLRQERTVVERLGANEHDAIDRHLREISASVGLRNTVLLHERCFLAVEGDTEQQCVPLLFRLSEGLSLQAAGIALWACGNNEGAFLLAKYLVEHGRSVLLMVDADSNAQKMFREDNLIRVFGKEKDEIVRRVGDEENREIEALFSDEVWASVANKRWPRDGGWSPSDFAALRQEKKYSKAVETMLREESELGPSGKPEMMYLLASSLTSPNDVPAELREVFSQLRDLAGR
jgi:putative ATP-dependent endonuclease of OLD family